MPPEADPCGQTHWNFVVSGCDSNNEREGTYSWKNPRPENPFLPSDCCIEEQNFGVNGSPCVEGANLPKNFTFDCDYIVADSPVSIAMIVINIIVILILVLLMVIYALIQCSRLSSVHTHKHTRTPRCTVATRRIKEL